MCRVGEVVLYEQLNTRAVRAHVDWLLLLGHRQRALAGRQLLILLELLLCCVLYCIVLSCIVLYVGALYGNVCHKIDMDRHVYGTASARERTELLPMVREDLAVLERKEAEGGEVRRDELGEGVADVVAPLSRCRLCVYVYVGM